MLETLSSLLWLLFFGIVGLTIFAIISIKGGGSGTTDPSQLSQYVELVYHDLQKQLNDAGYSLHDIKELDINTLSVIYRTDGVNSYGARCNKSFFVICGGVLLRPDDVYILIIYGRT